MIDTEIFNCVVCAWPFETELRGTPGDQLRVHVMCPDCRRKYDKPARPSWMSRSGQKECEHCGIWFTPKYPKQKLCFPKCWRTQKIALTEYEPMKARIAQLERALLNESLRAVNAPTDTPETPELRWAIQQLHPDKHGNAEKARRVTQWLLTLKSRKH